MTSFIIVARDKEKRLQYAKDFCNQEHISTFDISLIERETSVKQNATSIGIEDIKRLQKTIFLKPLKSQQKAIILDEAHLLTIEAQNALLKVLEEPPQHTLIILCTKAKEDLLPTILSRCQIITLKNDTPTITTREQNSIAQFIEALPSMTIGDKLKRAELLAKDKEKALDWVEKVIVIMHETLIKDPSYEKAATIHKFQTLHTTLKTTNVNPRFALENTFLHV